VARMAGGPVQPRSGLAGGIGQPLPDQPVVLLYFAVAGASYRVGVPARFAPCARADLGRRNSLAAIYPEVAALAALGFRQCQTTSVVSHEIVGTQSGLLAGQPQSFAQPPPLADYFRGNRNLVGGLPDDGLALFEGCTVDQSQYYGRAFSAEMPDGFRGRAPVGQRSRMRNSKYCFGQPVDGQRNPPGTNLDVAAAVRGARRAGVALGCGGIRRGLGSTAL